MLKVLDLFSGIGGFSLGLERTGGFRTIAFCEIDPYCQAVLRKHWPEVPIFGDIRGLKIKYVDVVCGGFPCQDISVAGRGEGLAGARSGLWHEFARLIGDIRPRYVIVENVAAITFRGLLDVLGKLTSLGYDAEWRSIRAADAGAPHGRRRIWIVAYPAGLRFPSSWECIQSRVDTKGAFAEADGLVAAFQEKALPYVCGRHDGVSNQLDELAIGSLGNSVLPQITQSIGQAILEAEAMMRADSQVTRRVRK